jgi:hypothetical protein
MNSPDSAVVVSLTAFGFADPFGEIVSGKLRIEKPAGGRQAQMQL